MDTKLRQLERLSYQDPGTRAEYLRAKLRIHPGMRKNIGFAAWMGDPAALLACEESVPQRFKLLPGESVSHNQKTWSSWKTYTRTLGKASILAALIPCIRYQVPEEKIRKELVGHYNKRILDKKYRPKYKHTILIDAPQRGWPIYSTAIYCFEGSTFNNRRNKELTQLMRVLSGPVYCSNHSAASASIIKSCTFKFMLERRCINEKTPELEAAIKKSCIDWALSR